MVKEVAKMEETKTNRIEVPIKDKYLLTIREAGAYFGLGTKYMRRIVSKKNAKESFKVMHSCLEVQKVS